MNNLEKVLSQKFQELSEEQIHKLASDIQSYWIDGCLNDVLEAMGYNQLESNIKDVVKDLQ